MLEGKTIENVNERLKDYKDLYYTKMVDLDTAFIVIKKAEYYVLALNSIIEDMIS